jgi:hypothetical protein
MSVCIKPTIDRLNGFVELSRRKALLPGDQPSIQFVLGLDESITGSGRNRIACAILSHEFRPHPT